ncbi:HNH endonuclease [Microbacterium lacus]|uniref:HNH endonuclease signature motif containing protein n=1 Tax=Microbacterium lacus TaxID=415217 RepID=UPI00385030EB
MNNLADVLAQLDAAVEIALGEVRGAGLVRGAADGDVLDAAATAAMIHRRLEGFLVEVTAEVQDRVDYRAHDERITTAHGCRNTSELMQRVTRCSPSTAAVYARIVPTVREGVSPTSGETLPADLPVLREALLRGDVGVDGMSALIGPLADLRHAVGADVLSRAESELAAAARGVAAPPARWQDLRLLAQVLVAYLDPDGAEPMGARAMRKRGMTIGATRDGLVPLHGNVLPEVAAQLQRLFDSILNPKVDGCAASGPRFVDSEGRDGDAAGRSDDRRTRAQKQHDALATVLSVAARAGELPTIGGAAPTLIVSVRAEDFESGVGRADVAGVDEPVSIAVARQVACTGSIERVVMDKNGRILSLGVDDRVFTHHQRRAIMIRDGNCIIPGCDVPASWCEIHHVEEHARGGPTHTDNGVLLCWHHHRTLDTGQWQIRMNAGVPQVRGPSWWDSSGRWRAVTSSRVRQLDRLSG